MERQVASGAIPGLVTLVSRGGEVRVEVLGHLDLEHTMPMRRDTIFRIASITKPVAGAAAMMLVDGGVLGLDEPVDRHLPELADRRVLRRLDGPLADTVPAERPITTRDLLSMTMGVGYLMAPGSWDFPICRAYREVTGMLQGPPHPQSLPGQDEWLRRLGSLPLMHQPGARWMYDLSIDVLGALISRASGQRLDVFMKERIFAPLGMKDTGFHVPAEKLHRFPPCYQPTNEPGKFTIYDEVTGEWARPHPFPCAASGLVSTVDDYFAFTRLMLNGGEFQGNRLLSAESVAAMTTDQLAPAQKEYAQLFMGNNRSWGLGLSVFTGARDPKETPRGFGWDGGTGTSAYWDAEQDLIGILLTQVQWTSPEPPSVRVDFWDAAYREFLS